MFLYRKKYERAEDEYVKSKLELHTKLEAKEQLTEHLYTIIHQNEIRKAEKLTGLMEQLSVEPSEKEILAEMSKNVPQIGLITMAQTAEKQHENLSNSSHLVKNEAHQKEEQMKNGIEEKGTDVSTNNGICNLTNDLIDKDVNKESKKSEEGTAKSAENNASNQTDNTTKVTKQIDIQKATTEKEATDISER